VRGIVGRWGPHASSSLSSGPWDLLKIDGNVAYVGFSTVSYDSGGPVSHLIIKEDVKDNKHAQSGKDKDSGVEPEQANAKSKIGLHRSEEDIQAALTREVVAVVVLLHFSLGDKVGDFFFDVHLFSCDSTFSRAELLQA
jgi:hypothetical protein